MNQPHQNIFDMHNHIDPFHNNDTIILFYQDSELDDDSS